MSLQEQTRAARVTAERERYVARGVSTPRLVVAGADGLRIEDVDGRSFVDFAGGIGCQNTGHGFGPVVAAIHEQVDRFLHTVEHYDGAEPDLLVSGKSLGAVS